MVVPVLVDGAELPSEASLPEDLRPLVRRQAATIRDESWHRDVDALIRQLTSGPDVVTPGRRNLALLVAALLALLAAAIVLVLVTRGGEDSSEDDEPPPCEPPDETWTTQTIEREPVAFEDTDGNRRLSIAPESWAWTPDGDGFLVLVTASVTNTSDAVPGTGDEPYITYTSVADLAVDRIQTSDLRCVTYVGSQELAPGRTVLVTLGFSTMQDPDGAPIVLDMQDGSEVPVVDG